MTYLEHKELAEQLREEAREALHRSVEIRGEMGSLDEVDGYEGVTRYMEMSEEADRCYRDYVRLSKLANKHWGIYQMVRTQRALRAERSAA